MDDEAIRELIVGARIPSFLRSPPGTRAVLRETLYEAAGEDFAAVERWIVERGGYEQIAPAVTSRGLRPGRLIARKEGSVAVLRDSHQRARVDRLTRRA
jgi:hypothetical protein